MKIHAEHVFYLNYMLPEFAGSDELRLDIHVTHDGDYHAFVVGWDQKEPLFFRELGASLSTAEFTMRPAWRPDGGLTHRVNENVVDRLIVALEWEAEVEPTADPAVTDLWLDRAVSTANYVLGHLRVVTQQSRVQKIKRYWKPGHSKFAVEVPYTVRWVNLTDRTPLKMFQGMDGFCSTGAIEVPHTGRVTLDALGASMSVGRPAPLHLSLLVDAEEALNRLNLREAVLCTASACEMRAGQYLKDQTFKSGNQLNNIGKGKPFAGRYFHELPTAICQRSLKTEDSGIFDMVQACYNQRNGLAHGGQFRPPFKDASEIDQHHAAYGWTAAARTACSWFDSLPTT
jgi:hypothetical protein